MLKDLKSSKVSLALIVSGLVSAIVVVVLGVFVGSTWALGFATLALFCALSIVYWRLNKSVSEILRLVRTSNDSIESEFGRAESIRGMLDEQRITFREFRGDLNRLSFATERQKRLLVSLIARTDAE